MYSRARARARDRASRAFYDRFSRSNGRTIENYAAAIGDPLGANSVQIGRPLLFTRGTRVRICIATPVLSDARSLRRPRICDPLGSPIGTDPPRCLLQARYSPKRLSPPLPY